ncbi:MAG: biopolymer transporter ExbD [Planctomycetes bacterium]|nr:biopolymer transporter ExbD [Planctomycetota bacterium]
MTGRRATFADAADDGWGGRERAASEADLDITPMIDVTFLLLIFFMVTSTMQASADLEIPAAKHGVGLESDKTTVIIVQNPGSEGDVPVIVLENGNEVSLEEVTSEVQQQMQDNISQVIIKADGRVTTGFVQEVVRAVLQVEGVGFSYAVRDKKTN